MRLKTILRSRAGCGVVLGLLACGTPPAAEVTAEASSVGEEPAPASVVPHDTPFTDPHGPIGDPLPDAELTGPDRDGDHIRDDVQRHIDEVYGDDERAWLAARQLARGFQHQLLDPNDSLVDQQVAHEVAAAVVCVNSSGLEAGARVDLLERTFDNEARFDAYRAFQGRIAGTQVMLPQGAACAADRRQP